MLQAEKSASLSSEKKQLYFLLSEAKLLNWNPLTSNYEVPLADLHIWLPANDAIFSSTALFGSISLWLFFVLTVVFSKALLQETDLPIRCRGFEKAY